MCASQNLVFCIGDNFDFMEHCCIDILGFPKVVQPCRGLRPLQSCHVPVQRDLFSLTVRYGHRVLADLLRAHRRCAKVNPACVAEVSQAIFHSKTLLKCSAQAQLYIKLMETLLSRVGSSKGTYFLYFFLQF